LLTAAAAFGLASGALAATHTVTIDGMQFTPAKLVVKPGDRVVWVNHDLVAHTATAAGRFDSGTLAAGHRWTWKASGHGSIDYVCTLHPTMKATLVVE
jgi:plastocyanin